MAKTNLAQHEQHLKLLETSTKEICDKHKQIDETIRYAWTMLNEMWGMTMQLFVVIEEVRHTRLEFEKNAHDS